MKTIKGIEIDEIKDLNFNLNKIRNELRDRINFWTIYNQAITEYEKKNRVKKASRLYKTILFVSLFPTYFNKLFESKEVEKIIKEAEQELTQYYKLPTTKVKQFRLKCEYEKNLFEKEMRVIEKELKIQKENLELESIGSQTKKEIQELINEFELKKKTKKSKYNFYRRCEEKLHEIEKQIKVKQSIERSRMKLEELREKQIETSKQKEIEKEFELYSYYGDLLDSISMNLKKLEMDKEEKIAELELKEMLVQLEIEN